MHKVNVSLLQYKCWVIGGLNIWKSTVAMINADQFDIYEKNYNECWF